MREILFRGKREDGEGLVYGHYHNTTYIGYPNGGNNQITRHYILPPNAGDAYVVIPETIGQFTGLNDKNDKKIFEGDIGRYKQTDGVKRNRKPITCIGKVIYNAKTASFAVESKDETGCKYFDYFPIKDFEVIGNIHDNPEILEVME